MVILIKFVEDRIGGTMLALFISLIAPNGDRYRIFDNDGQWTIRLEPYSQLGLDLWHYCPYIYSSFHSAIDSCNQHHDSGVWIIN